MTSNKTGNKKKVGDVFLKKEWYDIKAPSYFGKRQAGKTLVTRTQGTKIASEGLKNRIVEMNLADLNNDDDQGYRKMSLMIEDVQGRNCLTNFHGTTFFLNASILVLNTRNFGVGSDDYKITDFDSDRLRA